MRHKAYVWPILAVSAGAFTIVALLATSQGFAQAVPSGGDVAVCDVEEIFEHYDRANDLTADFIKRSEAITEEGKKRAARIEALREELEGLEPGTEDFEDLVQEIQRQTIEAQAWQDYKMTIARRDQHRLTTDMYDEILVMIETIATEQGYKIVLFRDSRTTQTKDMNQLVALMGNRKVLYSSPSVDVTQTVLARLNRQYNASRP